MSYLIIAFLIIIIAIVIFVFIRKKVHRNSESIIQEKAKLDNFKQLADKVPINLNDIEIKSNSWSEEVVTDNSKYGGYNQIGGRGDLNISSVQHNPNVLMIKIHYKNQPINIQYHVSMDLTTLKMKLALQEQTTLYINPENIEDYYLDMEFLD